MRVAPTIVFNEEERKKPGRITKSPTAGLLAARRVFWLRQARTTIPSLRA